MKIVFVTLLFTFMVFLNSIVLSSQMNHNGGQGGNNNARPREITIRTKTIQHPEPGQRFLLPNGNVYLSNGDRPIMMFFNVVERIVKVEQPPGTAAMVIRQGPFVGAAYDDWPGTFTYQAGHRN